ncbi:hypothetical protein [Streptococcus suis]|uniref:hypothetical protein n=1 Tax=Streptococcus suis TaxID=1307 RepID=UPI0004020C98|nr:hypothetical protein [Streptococcus suis]
MTKTEVIEFLTEQRDLRLVGSDIFLDGVPNYKWKKEPENQLTESEIKKEFEWAWQFREEVD